MKKLRVAIIGQGRSGRDIHARWIAKDLEDMYEIKAVVDPLEKRRERAEREFLCEAFENHRELFGRDDLDLVINAAPSHLHVPITLELLNAGFNVICDKPIAAAAADVDKLKETAEKKNRMLTVFQQSRYAPYFLKTKEIIDSGILGRVIQISIAFNGFARRWDWQCIDALGGGSLMNTGPHPLDQALQFLDTQDMPDVTCYMDRVNTFGDAEDYVKLLLHAKNRPIIDIEISSCCAYPRFTYNIQASKGGLIATMNEINWKYFKPEEAPEQKLIQEPLEDKDGNPIYCSESLKWYDGSWNVPEEEKDLFEVITGRYYKMIYGVLVHGEPLEITLDEVRQQAAVIEECKKQERRKER
jgi:scyllo-inositol 2-dehydrogenase (NADP+)